MTEINDFIDRIHNADCMDILRQLPDASIDLVVTDCPYKIVQGGVSGKTGYKPSAYMNNGSDVRKGKMFKENDIKFSEWLPEIYRVLKDGSHCYIMINGRNLMELQQCAIAAGFIYQNLLVWDKGTANPNKWYLMSCEFILMLRKGTAKKINNMGTPNILRVKNIVGHKIHPTEKPVELVQIMVENSSKEGEIVLDPFAGSSPLAVACHRTGRKFICIEKDESYYNVSLNRFEQEQSQLTLF